MRTSLIILLISLFLSACNQHRKPLNQGKHYTQKSLDLAHPGSYLHGPVGEPNTRIQGKVELAESKEIVFLRDGYADTAILNTTGKFSMKVPVNEPMYAKLVYNNTFINIYVAPGEDLDVFFNAQEIFRTVSFDKDVANSYLKEKHLLMLELAIPLSHLYQLEPDQFKRTVDSNYIVQKLFLEAKLKGEDVPEDFRTKESAALLYERATRLYEYPRQSTYTSLPGEYFKFENKVSPNAAELLDLYDYRTYLNAWLEYYTFQHFKEANKLNYSPFDYSLQQMQVVLAGIEEHTVKDYMLYTILKSHVKYYGFKQADALYALFLEHCQNEAMVQELMEPYKKYSQLQASGQAPEVSFISADKQQVRLSDFQGQYVYVDVWATWCKPCLKEAPHFETLREKYQQKNIVFLSLSIDKNTDKWQDYLQANHKYDDQFLVQEQKAFLDAYQIKTIPHFLLIDPQGKLIEANADRPSEIDERFFEALPAKSPA